MEPNYQERERKKILQKKNEFKRNVNVIFKFVAALVTFQFFVYQRTNGCFNQQHLRERTCISMKIYKERAEESRPSFVFDASRIDKNIVPVKFHI